LEDPKQIARQTMARFEAFSKNGHWIHRIDDGHGALTLAQGKLHYENAEGLAVFIHNLLVTRVAPSPALMNGFPAPFLGPGAVASLAVATAFLAASIGVIRRTEF
jgi:hypothetical protein